MSKVTILFKKLVPEAKAPTRAHDGDAGWDVTAVSVAQERGAYIYGTGLAFAIQEGYWMDLRARSSIYKTGAVLASGLGTIDAGFRNEVKAVFYTMQSPMFAMPTYPPYGTGDRIAQLIVQPALTTDVEFVEVDELPESGDGRGEGGFGSTGR